MTDKVFYFRGEIFAVQVNGEPVHQKVDLEGPIEDIIAPVFKFLDDFAEIDLAFLDGGKFPARKFLVHIEAGEKDN